MRKFSFRRAKKPFSIFQVQKTGGFVKQQTKWLIQNATTTFFKNTRPTYMDNVLTGGSQTFRSIPGEKDKFLPNQ
jgi:hypothetical protein